MKKAELVPFAVNTIGELESEQRVILGRRGQLIAEFT